MSQTNHDYTPIDPDTGFELSPEFVAEIIEIIAREDITAASNLVAPLPAPDQAELFEQLDHDQRLWLTGVLSANFDSETLAELSPEAAEDVLEALGTTKSAEMLAELETDDAIHILEDLPASEQQEILGEMPREIREEVEEGLTYAPESAGRLMRKTLVAVPEFWTVGDTIDFLRGSDSLPEFFYVIYTVDTQFRPTGRVLLGAMLGSKRDVALETIKSATTYAITTDTDQEEVAYLFRKYALVEAPVVDDQGLLVGTVTVDDVVDVIEEESEEDYLRASGISASDFQSQIMETVKARFGWLFINLLTAILSAYVVSLFGHSIEKLVTLAIVMPLIASMSGNTGTQTEAVAIRAIATRYLTDGNANRYMIKESLVGFINGIGIGVIMGLGSLMWFHDIKLAIVLLLSAIICMTIAGLFGAMVPILLHRRGKDPAISATIFLTTVTDCVGFFSFLGLATLIML